jgi:hypothetical protein
VCFRADDGSFCANEFIDPGKSRKPAIASSHPPPPAVVASEPRRGALFWLCILKITGFEYSRVGIASKRHKAALVEMAEAGIGDIAGGGLIADWG